MANKLRHFLFAGLAIGTLLLLSGCSAEVFNPKGPIAHREMWLLIDAVLLMCIIVVPVIIVTFVIAYRYRASNTKAKYSPNWSHNNWLEAGWWVLPIVIIVVLATMTWRTTHQLDPYKPLDSHVKPITIQAVSLEWRWLFIYPDQHIATMDFVEFPVNTPINFKITSDAPMNSFQIQQLAGQIYSMAGMKTQLHLMASEEGDYYGRSVSFSGAGFAGMQFTARVVNNDQFNQWVNTVKQSPEHLTVAAYNTLALPSEDHTIHLYSNVADDLFDTIIMKYVGPDAAAMGMNMSAPDRNPSGMSMRSMSHMQMNASS